MDSLFSVWKDQSQSDSIRVKAFKTYIWDGYLFSDLDSAILLINEMHKYAQKHNYPIAANQANTLLGIVYDLQGNFPLAKEYIEKSIDENEKIGNKAGVSEALIVLGVTYDEQANYPLALETYKKALVIDEEIDNKEGIAMSLNNIANIYSLQGNNKKALDYYLKALAIDEELGVKQGIAAELSNIGTMYQQQGEMDTALNYYLRAVKISQEIGDKESLASAYSMIADYYEDLDSNQVALAYYQKALELLEELGNKQGIAKMWTYIGIIHLNQENLNPALEYCKKGLLLAQEIGALEIQNTACECLYRSYKAKGDNKNALDYYEQMIVLKDSIYNEKNTKKLTQIEMQYDFDKKEAAAKAEQEIKDALALKELQRHKLVRNGFIGGFGIVLIFAGVFFVQRNQIGKEKKRSEELLLNILPEETAKELKEKGHSDAQLIDQVTVLFTDFKGFTAMSEKLSPKELVKDLHECFSAFDRICEKYDIEKIKTIGDAYMAAGGLPTPNITHAQDVVNAALEMSAFVETGKRKKIENQLPFFEIRIGIHTGPVVAGIVGIKKFQYDIWGDTVNTASRMESSGAVGKVNISESTYELIKDQFTCEHRGEIEAKGKGKLAMYFVS